MVSEKVLVGVVSLGAEGTNPLSMHIVTFPLLPGAGVGLNDHLISVRFLCLGANPRTKCSKYI